MQTIEKQPENYDFTLQELRELVSLCMKMDMPDEAIIRVDTKLAFASPAPIKRLCVIEEVSK